MRLPRNNWARAQWTVGFITTARGSSTHRPGREVVSVSCARLAYLDRVCRNSKCCAGESGSAIILPRGTPPKAVAAALMTA
jgi:hypothetical protein